MSRSLLIRSVDLFSQETPFNLDCQRRQTDCLGFSSLQVWIGSGPRTGFGLHFVLSISSLFVR
jgi:hypothetical protein